MSQQLHAVVQATNVLTADLLSLLSEVSSRQLFRSAGYASMLEYCVEELAFNERVALESATVAKAVRQHPAILHLVAKGRTSVGSLARIAVHLTPQNEIDLLGTVMVRERPELSKIPRKALFGRGLLARATSLGVEERERDAPGERLVLQDPTTKDRRYCLQLWLGKALFEKISRAHAVVRNPDGSRASLTLVLERAMDALLEKQARPSQPPPLPRTHVTGAAAPRDLEPETVAAPQTQRWHPSN